MVSVSRPLPVGLDDHNSSLEPRVIRHRPHRQDGPNLHQNPDGEYSYLNELEWTVIKFAPVPLYESLAPAESLFGVHIKEGGRYSST